MGYTHYWRHNRTIPQNIWNKIIKDIKKLLPRFKMLSIELTGWDGSGKPIFDKGQVSFNGRPEHETFSIDRDFDMYSRNHLTNLDNDGRSFSFCKTAMKPYDLAVTACLIVFTYHQPDILVSLDGEDRDWVKAKTLCQQVLGYGDNFRLPGDEDDRTRPNFRTNEKQRLQAGRWARVIQLHYKFHFSERHTAEEMGIAVGVVGGIKTRIRRALQGRRLDGSGCYWKKRGKQ